jgi:hypothetical protein
VLGVVDIEAEMIAAGIKANADSNDMIAVSSGNASLIYLHPDAEPQRDRLADFLASQPWSGQVIDGANLATVGQGTHNGLAFAVSLKADALENNYGVPGRSLAAKPRWDKPDRLGCGQHGGLAQFEQSPTLMIEGSGFVAGATRQEAAHVTDLAPSILRHLGIAATAMDGSPLQRVLQPSL